MIITDDELSYIKLIDFGLARSINGTSGKIDPKGSVFWMSPEIFDDKQKEQQSDIWSLGATMIEMVLI